MVKHQIRSNACKLWQVIIVFAGRMQIATQGPHTYG